MGTLNAIEGQGNGSTGAVHGDTRGSQLLAGDASQPDKNNYNVEQIENRPGCTTWY